MLDLVIRGGQVVTPRGAGPWELGIQGEQIVSVSPPGTPLEAGRTIDASPWEGWKVTRWPVKTGLRGRVIVENGQLHGNLADGQLVGGRSTGLCSDVPHVEASNRVRGTSGSI